MVKTPTPAQLARAAKPAVNKQVVDLTNDRDRYRALWSQKRDEVVQLRRKLDAAKAFLSAVRTVAAAALTVNDDDDEIPF